MREKANKMLGLKSSIVRRLILFILLFSLLITIIGTGVQLYLDYNHDLKSLCTALDQIELIHLSAISSSLWVTDIEHLEMHLEGILQMPNFQFIEIRKGTEILHSAGTPNQKI